MECPNCTNDDFYEEIEGFECFLYCKKCEAPIASRVIKINKDTAAESRKRLGISQAKLADFISKRIFFGAKTIDRRTISAMEKGRNPVAWYVAVAIDMIGRAKNSKNNF